MYRIDKTANRLEKLPAVGLSDAGYQERRDLQEWIAAQPDCLGEPLLILQKEFDGFDGTRERLDLLALDADGHLVVIENKGDDSGRDVAWQALKYAAYCSTMQKPEIVDVFQDHLRRHEGEDCSAAEAEQRICDFLDTPSLEETALNEGATQRILFVAAAFRREVTATVLWLREYGVDARCIRFALHRRDDEVLVDFQKVIPTPEAEDYMIRIASKEAGEGAARKAQRGSETRNIAFWTMTLERMVAAGCTRLASITPPSGSWVNTSMGVSGCLINLIFRRNEIRVEFSFERPDREENKRLFDMLAEERVAIDAALPEAAQWDRKDHRKSSAIVLRHPCNTLDEEDWPGMIEWLTQSYKAMDSTLAQRVHAAHARLQAAGG